MTSFAASSNRLEAAAAGRPAAEPTAYRFKPDEQPTIPGSPFNPAHPAGRMWAYALIGLLAGLTSGLGNALVTGNIAYFEGTLGLTAEETAWIPAVYATAYICANLVLVKFRQQFGLQSFVRLTLIVYAFATTMHLFIDDFWSAMLVRAVSGIAAAGLSTMGVLAWVQAMPPSKRLLGVIIGVGIPQIANPLARVIAPALLESGDWQISYTFEFGLALLTLAAVAILPLPPSERSKAFEKTDFVTIALLFPGIGLLCSVLALGRIDWWLSAPWLAWALIGAITLLAAAAIVEHRRANPLLAERFLGEWPVLRIVAAAFFVRLILAEQSSGALGLLTTLGFGTEQVRDLFAVVTLASFAGLLIVPLTFRPQSPGRPIQLACLLIAIAALLDSSATSLTGPANFYVSQALIGIAGSLFIGPIMVIGLARVLLRGPQSFVSWVVVFLATQNLGGLAGPALFGTVQIAREKFHSSILVQQVRLSDPLDAGAFGASAQHLGGVIADPTLRGAEGAALVARQVALQAGLLAWNDVFLIIALLASLLLAWGVAVEVRMRRRGELTSLEQLIQAVAARSAAAAPGRS